MNPQDILMALIATGAQHSAGLTQMADRNATQGLTVVNTTLIQQHGGVADDPAIFGALNTAAGIPQSGFQAAPKA
jgi:hypothetical protein